MMAKVKTLLEPHFSTFRSCVIDSVEIYRKNLRENPAMEKAYSLRTEANCLNDLICKFAQERFLNTPRVFVSNVCGFLLLVFDDVFNLRFKKLDHNKNACHNDTHQSQGFVRQQTPFFPRISNFDFEVAYPNEGPTLICGYQLDSFTSELAGIFITCPDGPNKNKWYFSIDKGLEDLSGGVLLQSNNPNHTNSNQPQIVPIVPPIIRPNPNIAAKMSEKA